MCSFQMAFTEQKSTVQVAFITLLCNEKKTNGSLLPALSIYLIFLNAFTKSTAVTNTFIISLFRKKKRESE